MSLIPPDHPPLSESGVLRLDSAMRPEARYRALVETLPDVLIVLFDTELRILSVEGGGVDQLPMPASAVIGKRLHEIGSPDQIRQVEPHYRAALRGEDSQFDYEFASGTTWWIQVIPMVDEDGRICGGMSHWRDVTKRIAAERAVAAYARELERSNAELQQYAYVASHDLSEPLRMINGYLKLLQRRYRDDLDEDAQQFIEYAADGAARMRGLIDDLLAFSRLGSEATEHAPVPLQQLVESTWRVLTAEREGPEPTLLATGLPVIYGDARQLGQVFQNLLSNALKFVEPGRAPVVEIHSTPLADGGWRIVVDDEGIGFDPTQAERMFRVFQRLHTRDEFPGTGVGLAIARKVIERHGGRIWAESRAGGGARFCIELPATAARIEAT
jgi:PAS domain S-box-containing protein